MKWIPISALAALTMSSLAQADGNGVWSQEDGPLPQFIIHAVMLPNGNLLVTNRDRTASEFGSFCVTPFKTAVILAGTQDALGQFSYNQLQPVPFHDTDEHSPYNTFCAGHTLLANGQVFFAGGHLGNDIGGWWTSVYDSNATEANPFGRWFLGSQQMSHGRWYPTCLRLPDGRVLIFGGTVNINNPPWGDNRNHDVEFWMTGLGVDGTQQFLSKQPSMSAPLSNTPQDHTPEMYYPHMFIDPKDGNVINLYNGRPQDNQPQNYNPRPTEKFDLRTMQISFPLAISPADNVGREYPSSCFVDGMIIRSGGGKPSDVAYATIDQDETDDATHTLYWATPQTFFCNLYNQTPSWTIAPPMNMGRKNHFLVPLPTGQVVALGGNQFQQRRGAKSREVPEMWDPYNPTNPWQLLSSPPEDDDINSYGKGYHSVAMLLPDGRIFTAGGEYEYANTAPPDDQVGRSRKKRTVRIFSPPYANRNDWQTVRPSITACPTEMRNGEQFDLSFTTQNGKKIGAIALIGLPSVTHGFNESPYFTYLFKSGKGLSAGAYKFTTPDIFKAPPGYYMLFVMDDEGRGIPSVAKIVRIRDFDPSYPTALGAASTAMGTLSELYSPDNIYLGKSIGAVPSGSSIAPVAVDVETIAPYGTPRSLKFQTELHTATPGTIYGFVNTVLSFQLWNWRTSAFETIAPTVNVTGAEKIYQTTIAGAKAWKYIRTGDRKVWGRMIIAGSVPFEAWIDTMEFGYKPMLQQGPGGEVIGFF